MKNTLKIKKGENETSVTKLAIRLGVTRNKVNNEVEKIATKYDCPRHMVFSTNHKGQPLYSVERFAKLLNVGIEIIEPEIPWQIVKNNKYKEILRTQGKKAASEFWLKR